MGSNKQRRGEQIGCEIMKFSAVADTDIGINKAINQDSLLIKHAIYENIEVLMAVVCDGMGGLSKGELASATVIRIFSDWFTNVLPFELQCLDFQILSDKLTLLLKDINARIIDYGQKNGVNLGTTVSGILFIEDKYLIHHIGDSRIYHINSEIKQLTIDQTFVEREVVRGRLTPEQAKTDKRRNLLLQCVGASKIIEPQVIFGMIEPGSYLLCSDGFRHTITENEMLHTFGENENKEALKKGARLLIDAAKNRGEKDNISVIVVKIDSKAEER